MKNRVFAILLALAMLLSLSACGMGQSAPKVFEVRFELNGGTLVSGELLQRVEEGSAAAAPVAEREGYELSGWNGAYEAVTENTVAVAVWTKLPEPEPAPEVFEVRFELNGGTLVSGELLQRVEAGSAALPPETEREGYELSGWDGAYEAVTENTVAVAVWTKLPEPEPAPVSYEIRFEMNGGNLVSGHLLQRVAEGGAAEAPELTREGYAFDGWSDSFDEVNGNVITAAMWAKLYSIRFDPNGGELPEGQEEQWVKEGDLPAAPTPTRRNYSFTGWSPALSAASADAVYIASWEAVRLSSEQVFDKISPAVVEVIAFEPSGEYYSLGSGFFIDDTGRFVTNYHVIDGTISGQINMQDGSSCDILSVLGYDATLDLAIVQADVSGNPYLEISDRDVATGETIYALGSSEGLTSTFSTGIVSSASRDMEGVRCIQITAPISHGNSGGPLVNVFGEVVGVNSMTLIEGQNLNFAIDIDELEKLDLSAPMTLEEVYALMYPAGSGTSGGGSSGGGSGESESDDSFYSYTDYAEEEPNDSFLRSDQMINGEYIAGEVSNMEDLDWFYIEISRPGDVSFEVVPGYIEDMDYLLCGVFRLSDEEGTELLDVLSPSDNEDYVSMTGTIHFDEAGVYLLLICMDDGYPYSDPLYYAARADW